MNRPLRVAFMTTIGRNVGDEFIREGIRSFFDDAIGAGRYEAFHVCKHDLETLANPVYDESEQLSDKFRDADVIVQAGAPVYWSNGRFTSCNSEWAQALWYDRIFKLGGEKLILNLGAGAGQKSIDDLNAMIGDEGLATFARSAGEACAWTTVRDPLAHAFLEHSNVAHDLIPCPAFHAARRFAGNGAPPPAGDFLAVNLMKIAGHYRMKPQTDASQWRGVIDALLPRLRSRHRLLFVAHDQAEADFQRELAHPGEHVFLAGDYRDYISLYGKVKGIVANRVHGAVCVAGFGRPAVIVGNDCRIGIGTPIGIPARDSADATADWIERELEAQFTAGETFFRERLALREASASIYITRIAELTQAWLAGGVMPSLLDCKNEVSL